MFAVHDSISFIVARACSAICCLISSISYSPISLRKESKHLFNKLCEEISRRHLCKFIDAICSILDEKVPSKTLTSYKELITFVEDRAGHDRRYAIDATKLENELGWKANENFDSGIVLTVDWYLGKYNI